MLNRKSKQMKSHHKSVILGPKMAHPHNSGSALRAFFTFCRMKAANMYMKILLVVFWEQNSFGTIWSFQPLGHFLLFDWAWSNWARSLLTGSLNSQDMISFMITNGSLNSQGMIRTLKQWRRDFLGKHLCRGYCMDIMWCSCVEVKIHGFVKLLEEFVT